MFIHSVHPKICSDTLQFMIFDFFFENLPKNNAKRSIMGKMENYWKICEMVNFGDPHGRSLIDRITGISRGDQKCPEEYVCVIWCT